MSRIPVRFVALILTFVLGVVLVWGLNAHRRSAPYTPARTVDVTETPKAKTTTATIPTDISEDERKEWYGYGADGIKCRVSFGADTTIARQKSDAAPEIPTLTQCDLVSNPQEYNKKEVRIRALYYVGFEISVFSGPKCNNKGGIWVEFTPSFERGTDKKIYKKFMHLTDTGLKRTADGGHSFFDRSVEIVAVGWFESDKLTQNINGKTVQFGFGHLGGYDYRFTIARIEEVKALPEKKP